MRLKLWLLSMVFLPAFSMAADAPRSLKFFDFIPGLGNTNNESSSRISGKALDLFLEKWGLAPLDFDNEAQKMKLPSDPSARLEMIQMLIHFRIVERAAMDDRSSSEMQSLDEDLEWAARNGFPLANPRLLRTLEEKLYNMTPEERIRYAQKTPGPLGHVILDATLRNITEPEVVLKFLIQNPQSLPPERRDTLLYWKLSQLPWDYEWGRDDFSKLDITLVRKAAALLDYRNRHTVCRTASHTSMPYGEVYGSVSIHREYYEFMTRGLVEMQKQNVDCKEYQDPETMIYRLESFEKLNFYGRGFFTHMIQKLQGAGEAKSTASPSVAVQNPTLNQCLVDKRYTNEVEVEFNKMNTAPVGSSNLFGANSKGDCKLRVVVQKLKAGFKAYIVVENPIGATLIRFDQKFKTIQEMKNAAIFGVVTD